MKKIAILCFCLFSVLLVDAQKVLKGEFLELNDVKELKIYKTHEVFMADTFDFYFPEGTMKMKYMPKINEEEYAFFFNGKGGKQQKLKFNEMWGFTYVEPDGSDTTYVKRLAILKTYVGKGGVKRYGLFKPMLSKNDFVTYLGPGQDIATNRSGKLYYTDQSRANTFVFYDDTIADREMTVVRRYSDFLTLFAQNKAIEYSLPYISNYAGRLKRDGEEGKFIDIRDVWGSLIEQLPLDEYYKQPVSKEDLEAAKLNWEQYKTSLEEEEEEEKAEEKAVKEAEKAEKTATKEKEKADKAATKEAEKAEKKRLKEEEKKRLAEDEVY